MKDVCARRLPNGGWCVLEDRHEGVCIGKPRLATPPPPNFSPKKKEPTK